MSRERPDRSAAPELPDAGRQPDEGEEELPREPYSSPCAMDLDMEPEEAEENTTKA